MSLNVTDLRRSGVSLIAGAGMSLLSGFANAAPPYAEPTPEDMAEAVLKNQEVTTLLLSNFMFDRIGAKRCGFERMEGLKSTEALGILKGCMKVRKLKCIAASRGYVCDFLVSIG